jgi:hypothetical protein
MKRNFAKFAVIASLAVLMLAGVLGAKAFVSVGDNSADSALKNRFQQAKQKYTDEVNSAGIFKKAFENAQTKFKNSTAATSTKSQLKEQFYQKAGQYLTKEISVMIKYLEAMKNKVTNMQKMDDGDRSSILSKINENIAWLQQEQSKIDGASADQLKTISQEVRSRWANIRVASRMLTGQVLASRIKFLIGKAEAMGTKLEAKIQELKQAGKDTAQLETLLADFDSKLASAKDSYNQAKAKFQAITGKDNVVQFYQDGKNLVQKGNQYLKQAYQDLVQMVRRIKQLEPPKSDNATSTPKVHSGNEPG